MINHHCCEVISSSTSHKTTGVRIAIGDPRARTLARRCRDILEWIVPGGILVLLPKCPACLAAYFALGTGIGISMSTAIYIKLSLMLLCVVSLIFLVARQLRPAR
jgi:hypothetical protein